MGRPVSIVLLLLFACTLAGVAQTGDHGQRPRVGLTLSGGGAKGLAHIGILKAIDSAGLRINYVTGTSMGSIIGSLYAAGYSADSIETIARSIDWDQILSNQSSLRNIIMEEKSEYGKYDVELPWVNNWFRLSTGVLEGQELWLKFSELLFPVSQIKDFNKLPIPFRCIATDLSTGEAVVLDSGEVVSAVRASMAIPSIFTAVEFNGKKLVDGGVVRNFPVSDVKDMGADLVIGSNVASGLRASDKVTTVLQVLLQVAFFREAEDTKKEVPLCDVYVQMPIENYSMGSFSNAKEILDYGVAEGRALYPRLKKMADSLDAIYGPPPPRKTVLPALAKVRISDVEVRGLNLTTRAFFLHTMGFVKNHSYSPQDLSHMVRRANGTRYFNRIVYSLQPQADGSSHIIFDVGENALTFAKIGLHYDQFSGIGAILNLTSRDLFIANSRSLVTVNIGESFRVRGEHLQYIGKNRNFSLALSTQFDDFNVTSYNQTKEAGIYSNNYFVLDGRFGYATNRNLSIGAGSRFEWVRYNPSITSALAVKGDNNFWTSYVYLRTNTLDRPVFPRRGIKLDLEGDWVYRQHPDIQLHSATRDQDTATAFNPYPRILFNMNGYAAVSRRNTLLMSLQSGIDFRYNSNIMNEFSIGGLINTFHNQVTFAGLREGSFYTPSFAAAQLGLRYQLFSNTFITGRANVLFNNFISKSIFFNNPDFLSGYSLSASYNFALGPLELSAMYCDQWKRVMGYVNIGIPF